MASNLDLELETLFARISSPRTAERFKRLSSATSEDLANTFQPEEADSIQRESLLHSHSDPNDGSYN